MEEPVEIEDSHQQKWDQRFLTMAKLVASWSKDPSTQTGAVLVDPCNRVVSVGFNGFPQRIADDERLQDRAMKYEIIVHCEINALVFACSNVAGCTLYTWPFMSCSRCAAIMIQAGIRRHVASRSNQPRWVKSFELATQVAWLFGEYGKRGSAGASGEAILGQWREKAARPHVHDGSTVMRSRSPAQGLPPGPQDGSPAGHARSVDTAC